MQSTLLLVEPNRTDVLSETQTHVPSLTNICQYTRICSCNHAILSNAGNHVQFPTRQSVLAIMFLAVRVQCALPTFLPRDATQSAVMKLYVVCPSVPNV